MENLIVCDGKARENGDSQRIGIGHARTEM